MELLQLIAPLLIGLAISGVAVWLVLRGRVHSATAGVESLTQERDAARSELAAARSAAEVARSEASQMAIRIEAARAEVADARRLIAEAKHEAAEARSREADVRAELAVQAAAVAEAQAQRDAARQQAAEVIKDRDLMTMQFKTTSTELLELQGRKADEVAEKRLRAADEALRPVHEALLQFQDRLNQVEKDRLAMTKDLQAQVQAVRTTGDGLRQETSALVTALRKPQVRGAWGEMQLRRVAEVAGMVENCDFDVQVSESSQDGLLRPDMRVNLAGGKYVYVDAKVPLAAFLDAQEATDERERVEALSRFGKNLKTHIDGLSSKQYWKLTSGSPEFVVMFLASDAFLQEGLEQVPDLHEYAASRDVVLATPAILIAMLRAIAYGWRQSNLADNAAQVLELGRELYQRISKLGQNFDKVGRQLASTVNAYNDAVGTLEGRVLAGARKFRDLKVSDAELAAVTSRDETVRSLKRAELFGGVQPGEELPGAEPQPAIEASAGDVTEADGAALPESAELRRPTPDATGLVTEHTAEIDESVDPPIHLEWRRATMGR